MGLNGTDETNGRNEVKEFKEELEVLCKKYEIRNGCFAGDSEKENKFLGIMAVNGAESTKGIFASVLNIGRLWQQARSCTKNILDEFEGGWK